MEIELSDTATVTVPRWALEYLMEHGRFEDEGPVDYPFMSKEMREAHEAVSDALVTPQSTSAAPDA